MSPGEHFPPTAVRIADALERIAAALERIADQGENHLDEADE